MCDYVDIPPYCISIAGINPVSFFGCFLSMISLFILKKTPSLSFFYCCNLKEAKKDHNLHGHDPLPIYI